MGLYLFYYIFLSLKNGIYGQVTIKKKKKVGASFDLV